MTAPRSGSRARLPVGPLSTGSTRGYHRAYPPSTVAMQRSSALLLVLLTCWLGGCGDGDAQPSAAESGPGSAASRSGTEGARANDSGTQDRGTEGGKTEGTGAQNPSPLAAENPPQGHVYAGVTEEPSDVNPYTSHESVARAFVLHYTHDTLLDRDPETGELCGMLAESWQLDPDGLGCTFTLREGVRFSDGAPLTMDDVVFGYRLHEAGHLPEGFVGAAYARTSGIEVLDERRLHMDFEDRHFAVLASVGESWIVGQRRFFVEQVRERLDEGEQMPAIDSARFAQLLDQVDDRCGPGTGPYRLQNDPDGESTWRRRMDLTVTRNEHSWYRKAHPGTWNLDGVRVLFRDPSGAKNALLRREVDWYSGAQIDELLAANEGLAEDYRKLVYDYPRLGVLRLVWNMDHEPYRDPRVRRALGMLIDRDALVEVFGGAAVPATAHDKVGSGSYPDVAPLAFDVAGARRLLQEAGYDGDNPLKLHLLAPKGTEELRRVLELFESAARKAGVELDIHERVMSAMIAEKKLRDWHGLLALQFFDSWCDPYDYLHTEGRDNWGRWSHAEADRLAADAQVEADPVARAALWRKLHELAHEQQPVTLLVHPLVSLLLHRRLQDCEPGPTGLKPYRAWVEPDKQLR